MTVFILAASAVTLLALTLLLRPLVARVPLAAHRRDWRTVSGIALAVPAAAVALYMVLGQRAALEPVAAAPAGDPQVERMVAALAARLEREPEDMKGWVMLARSYKVMGRLREAEAAYDHAAGAIARDAQELANYADVAASNAGGHFAGKPARLIEQALRADAQNAMALWLGGAAAVEGGDARAGIAIWRKLHALLPPDSDDARELAGQIVQAGGEAPAAPPVGDAAVSGRVELAAGMKAAPDAAVYIVARAAGQRAPVAVVRTTVAQLPFAFRLDDARSMNPQQRISSLRQVSVEARISESGNPAPQAGDLVSDSMVVAVGAGNVALKITKARAAE